MDAYHSPLHATWNDASATVRARASRAMFDYLCLINILYCRGDVQGDIQKLPETAAILYTRLGNQLHLYIIIFYVDDIAELKRENIELKTEMKSMKRLLTEMHSAPSKLSGVKEL